MSNCEACGLVWSPSHRCYEADCQPKPSEGTDDKQLAAIRASCETPARAGTQYQADVRFLFATIERQAGEIARLESDVFNRDNAIAAMRTTRNDMQKRLMELEADLAAARLNERRYLWLKTRFGIHGPQMNGNHPWYFKASGILRGSSLDAAIDLAAGDGK